MSNLITRGYRLGDEYNILEMFNEVFNQNRNIDHWYWKYRDNPYGRYYFSLTVSTDGILAAHYGGYPVKITYSPPKGNCSEFKTLQIGDKMSRPCFRSVGFRNQGVLAKAFFHFRDNFGRSVPFGYGFGTHHSLRLGILLFDYMKVEKVPFRKMPFLLPEKNFRSRMFSSISSIKVEEVSYVDKRWTDFFYKVAPYYVCLITRDAEYLDWRYLKHPDCQYLLLVLRKRKTILGWAVFSRDKEVINWVDGLIYPQYGHYARYILDYLKRHPIAKEASYIHCWFPSRPDWWDNILIELGFFHAQEPNDLHLSGPIFTKSNSERFLRSNFYYTMGDSDLF